MRRQSHDEFMNSCEKFTSVLNETLIPLNSKESHRTMIIGEFICQISEGCFVRTSGNYKYNVLVTGKTGSLTGNDMKQLFSYK